MNSLQSAKNTVLKPLLTRTKMGWAAHYSDDYDVMIDQSQNTITVNSKFYKDKSVTFVDNHWVGITENGQTERLDIAESGCIYHEKLTEASLFQVKALGLINGYDFSGAMKHNIVIQPAFQSFLSTKNYKTLQFGGQIVAKNCCLGHDFSKICSQIDFMGSLQALIEVGDNEYCPLFVFQDIWLQDAEQNRLDLAWHIIPQESNMGAITYQFYVEIAVEEILTRSADIVIDPSLGVYASYSHSHHGNALSATSDGKLLYTFGSSESGYYNRSNRIYLTNSKDNGLTWNTPWVLVDSAADTYAQYGVGDPMLLTDGFGNSYALFLAGNDTGVYSHIGGVSSELYIRKMMPDDSFSAAMRVSTDETTVATYLNGSYLLFSGSATSYMSGFGVYDAYIFDDTLVIAWWSSQNELNQQLVVRELNLSTMMFSDPVIVNGLVGSAYGSGSYSRASVLIRPSGNIAYIGVNYGVLQESMLNFSLVQYDVVTKNIQTNFTLDYATPVIASNIIGHTTGVPCFEIINDGQNIVILSQEVPTSAICVCKSLNVSDGTWVKDIAIPTILYKSGTYYAFKALPLAMPSGDRYFCDADKFIKLNSITGDVEAILYSCHYWTYHTDYWAKDISKIPHSDRVFHLLYSRSTLSVVGYTSLGGKEYSDTNCIVTYMGLVDNGYSTEYLTQQSIFVDNSNIGHLVVDGKYYRSNNPVTEKPRLADFVFVDVIPGWIIGTHRSASVYYDYLSDNLYLFVISDTTVSYCRRHAGVYTGLQTLSVPVAYQDFTHRYGSGTSGVIADKNNNIICSIGYNSSGAVALYKVDVTSDVFAWVATPTVPSGDSFLTGTPIKNNVGDILVPFIVFRSYYSTTQGLGYFQWDGSSVSVVSVPTQNFSGGAYLTVLAYPFNTSVFMFQDFQGEYYLVYQYQKTSGDVACCMMRTFNGIWQDSGSENNIPLGTNLEYLGLGSIAIPVSHRGIGRQGFFASLNPWRNKLVLFVAYQEKLNHVSDFVPGTRWLEYDTQTLEWKSVAPGAMYENSALPWSGFGSRGALYLLNNYGDPTVYYFEGSTGTTSFTNVGKLTIIEIDYTKARVSNSAPESPIIRAPLTQTSVYNTVTPTLSWYVAPDAQFDNQHYNLEISTTKDFASLVGSANSAIDQSSFRWFFGGAELPFPAEGVSSMYGTYESPSMYVIFNVPVAWGLELNTEYYWRVKTIG